MDSKASYRQERKWKEMRQEEEEPADTREEGEKQRERLGLGVLTVSSDLSEGHRYTAGF